MTSDAASSRTDVTTPVFWSSLLGILAGSILGGLTYLGLIGDDASTRAAANVARPVVVLFCCLLCIRYYASIVFVSYDDLASPYASRLSRRAKVTIFVAQAVQILGCTLNIALLPVFGAVVATAVILCQGAAAFAYWWHLAGLLKGGKDRVFRPRFLLLGDALILLSAAVFFTWELGIWAYDETGAGMCLGVILLIFVVECVTTYPDSVVRFVRATTTSLTASPSASA